MSWCASNGGAPAAKDMVAKMSKLAAGGRHKQNAERDLQTAIRMYGRSLGAKIDTCKVRVWDPAENRIVTQDMEAARLYACM